MNTLVARRPWVTAGVALTAASMVAVAPMTPAGGVMPIPSIPDIELTGLGSDTVDSLVGLGDTLSLATSYAVSGFIGSPIHVAAALIEDPMNAGTILGELGGYLGGIFDSLSTTLPGLALDGSDLASTVGLFINPLVGPAVGPLINLVDAVTGVGTGGVGGLLSLPETLLNTFLNGGASFADGPLSFLGESSAGILTGGFYKDFGPVSLALLPAFLGGGLLSYVRDFVTPSGVPGLLGAVAGQLDGLVGTDLLGLVDDVSTFLSQDILAGVKDVVDDIGLTLGNGLNSLLGGITGADFAGLFGDLGQQLISIPNLLLLYLL